MRTITLFEAFDGRQFPDAESCKAYEDDNTLNRAVGLTIERLNDALERRDIELADALEEIGRRCSVARREAGEYRRTPRGSKAAEQATEPKPPEEPGPPDHELDPAYRGDRDFKAGKTGMVPDDLKADRAKAERWLAAWDAASVAAGQAGKVAA